MIIQISTIREIEDKYFEDYVRQVNEAGIPLDGVKLKKNGEYKYRTANGIDFVETKYRII